jgi:uncharacterized protein (UPF0332 family)
MTEDQRDLLAKARKSILAAEMLLANGFPGFAVSRAYYAMFYTAQAFLEGEALAFSRHSAVIAAFGKHFARTGSVPPEFHRYLIEAFDARHQGDYAPQEIINSAAAAEHIARARQFLTIAQGRIGPLPPVVEDAH